MMPCPSSCQELKGAAGPEVPALVTGPGAAVLEMQWEVVGGGGTRTPSDVTCPYKETLGR